MARWTARRCCGGKHRAALETPEGPAVSRTHSSPQNLNFHQSQRPPCAPTAADPEQSERSQGDQGSLRLREHAHAGAGSRGPAQEPEAAGLGPCSPEARVVSCSVSSCFPKPSTPKVALSFVTIKLKIKVKRSNDARPHPR